MILQNNARIGDNVPDHGGYSWLFIPRAMRVLEAGLVAMAFVLLQPLLARSRFRTLNALLWLLMATAVIGALWTPTDFLAQVQGIYVYVAPFLVFLVAWMASPDRLLVARLTRLLSGYVVLSIGVALLVQLPEAGTKGDLIHGFFSDAHMFGSFLAIGSCVAFVRFLEAGGLPTIAVAGVLLAISYYPANEKVIIFNVAFWAVVLAKRLLLHPRGRRGLAVAAAIVPLAVALSLGRGGDAEPLIRAQLLSERKLTEIGPVRSMILSWRVVSASPVELAIGLGPGNYAGLAAATAAQASSRGLMRLSRAARNVLLEDPGEAGAIAWATNTWSNLLAEFGLVGFGIFAAALVRVTLPIYRWRAVDRFDSLVRSAFLATLSVVVWQGCFTPYTNWSEPALVYPMMVLAAYGHRFAPQDVLARRARTPGEAGDGFRRSAGEPAR